MAVIVKTERFEVSYFSSVGKMYTLFYAWQSLLRQSILKKAILTVLYIASVVPLWAILENF